MARKRLVALSVHTRIPLRVPNDAAKQDLPAYYRGSERSRYPVSGHWVHEYVILPALGPDIPTSRFTVGSDVRRLVQDGYPAERVFGTDLHQEYIDLGHKLYGDADSCTIRFFSADLLEFPLIAPSSEPSTKQISDVKNLEQLRGRLTHIYTGALFHLVCAPASDCGLCLYHPRFFAVR
jgi:hypothetical protein